MIPAIGLIISCYTVVRFLSIIQSKDENFVVKCVAVLALLITVATTVGLLNQPPMPRF